jgi:hypothetical protein
MKIKNPRWFWELVAFFQKMWLLFKTRCRFFQPDFVWIERTFEEQEVKTLRLYPDPKFIEDVTSNQFIRICHLFELNPDAVMRGDIDFTDYEPPYKNWNKLFQEICVNSERYSFQTMSTDRQKMLLGYCLANFIKASTGRKTLRKQKSEDGKK